MQENFLRLVLAVALAGVASAPRTAAAFCGFYVAGEDTKLYNNATQVVLMRDGTRTVLSMQNNYQGPPSDFAMVVPVPVVLKKENVKTLSKDVFDKIEQLDAPRLVEYWEQDPCYEPPRYTDDMLPMAAPASVAREEAAAAPRDLGVRIEAKFTVGEYDIVILSARDSTGLDTWLRQEKYKIPEGAEPYLKPYVLAGSKFFVAKVDPKKVHFENGMAALSPLRFHYDAETFSLPVRLGLINAKDAQDLIVHILARGQRYEVANYPNVTIPTNIDVNESVKGKFGAFYASLFDATLERHPKAVVTEYAWDAMSCDPCPGPTLDGSDLGTLGADVLPYPGSPEDYHSFSQGGFTLTRLHARYTKDALGADLVFKAAPPIVGGREFMIDGDHLEHGARPDATNNFQGRYAIRHRWTGPIACAHPKRGVWGGPPADVAQAGGDAAPKAARNLAFAPRGEVSLAAVVQSEVPELGISGPPAASLAATAPKHGGCAGCSTSPSAGQGVVFAGLGAALVAILRRRRRK
jgi:MYXO-CTERM domain-containing protein